MQSAKKRVTALSALSMAALATMGGKSAAGAALSFYYDNVNILTGQAAEGTTGTVATAVNATTLNATPTITLQVGQVLEFGIDAAVTGVTNPAGGTGTTFVEPTNYGMAVMGLQINSTDSNSSKLSPLNDGTGLRTSESNEYYSTAFYNLNTASGLAGAGNAAATDGGALNGTKTQGMGNNTTGLYIPSWASSTADVGDSSPTVSGGVGTNFKIGAGSTASNGLASTALGINELGAFGASANSLAQATDFVDSLQWSANASGTVTLSPFSPQADDSYWSQTNSSTGTGARFTVHNFSTNDTITNAPQLVVVIAATGTGTGVSSSPIFSLTSAAPGSAYGSQITNGTGNLQGTFTGPGASNNTLTVTGPGNGYYTVQQATGIKDGSGGAAGPQQGYVAANGFNPTTDKEIFALDVEVGGTQASPTQLNTLLAQAGTTGGFAGVTVTTIAPAPDPFSGIYNFFVDYSGASGDDDLGWDLLSTNNSNLVGFTVSAVAVVPEPMSLGLLALGGVGLMARRNRRKA